MIKKKDCSFYYEIPIKLTLIGNWFCKEVQLSNGNWLYYREYTYAWIPPK